MARIECLDSSVIGVLRKRCSNANITEDTVLSGLGLASIDILEIVFEIEDILGHECDIDFALFSDHAAEGIFTVSDLLQRLERN